MPPLQRVFPPSSSSSSSSAVEPSASAAGLSVQRPSITSSSASVDRSRPDFLQLQSESVRLSTFHDWPESAGRIVDPRDLAATGFFYTGHADCVQCAFCRGCLRNWKPGDSPAEEHRRHFHDCPLMRAAFAADVDTRTSLTTDSRPQAISASPTFTSSSSRLVSFNSVLRSSVLR